MGGGVSPSPFRFRGHGRDRQPKLESARRRRVLLREGNLLTRTSIAPGGSWSYAEPHRGDGRDALRGFGFETISGSRYAYAVVRWSHALPSDTVAVESISDADPNDRYVVHVDHEQSEDSLQVLVFRKE